MKWCQSTTVYSSTSRWVGHTKNTADLLNRLIQALLTLVCDLIGHTVPSRTAKMSIATPTPIAVDLLHDCME